ADRPSKLMTSAALPLKPDQIRPDLSVLRPAGGGPVSAPKPRRKFYLPVPAKFTLALIFAVAWTTLSVWLSQRWLEDLAEVISWPAALIVIGFIAYVPGFMNAFLVSTILMDRRPVRTPQSDYPAVSILVACYNEEASIGDTLNSLSQQDYPGEFEVLVLNDGSTDRTLAEAMGAAGRLNRKTHGDLRVIDFAQNCGKAG